MISHNQIELIELFGGYTKLVYHTKHKDVGNSLHEYDDGVIRLTHYWDGNYDMVIHNYDSMELITNQKCSYLDRQWRNKWTNHL